ncbi:MAG: RNA 2',3'-cyclic phosphodiesterase [bacterium]
MQHQRIFTAVNISVASVRKLAELQQELRRSQSSELKMRWVPPANIHMTLKFYGELTPEQVGGVADAARKAAVGVPPFDVSARGLGVFPDAERPRVLWVGLEEGREPLTALRQRIEDESDAIGFARDSRSFRGHLTLGRVRRGAEGIQEWLTSHAEVDCLTSTINEIIVYESRLHRTGAEYVSHYRVPLVGK